MKDVEQKILNNSLPNPSTGIQVDEITASGLDVSLVGWNKRLKPGTK